MAPSAHYRWRKQHHPRRGLAGDSLFEGVQTELFGGGNTVLDDCAGEAANHSYQKRRPDRIMRREIALMPMVVASLSPACAKIDRSLAPIRVKPPLPGTLA